MGRREVREKIFQLLYQLDIQKDDHEEQIVRYLEVCGDENFSKSQLEYMDQVIHAVQENITIIDGIISPNLRKWKINRLPKVDLAILRLCTYEILYKSEEIPYNVAINEAVLLAKKFSNEESKSYINAVLANIKSSDLAKAMEPDEEETVEETEPVESSEDVQPETVEVTDPDESSEVVQLETIEVIEPVEEIENESNA